VEKEVKVGVGGGGKWEEGREERKMKGASVREMTLIKQG